MKLVTKEIDAHEISSTDTMSEYIVYVMTDDNKSVKAREVIGDMDRFATEMSFRGEYGIQEDTQLIQYGKILNER